MIRFDVLRTSSTVFHVYPCWGQLRKLVPVFHIGVKDKDKDRERERESDMYIYIYIYTGIDQ